ncbi:ribose operon repressor [Streptomyces himastatinicus ATCC 53653]|uniref:Ribose operon repressor n=1 Tax=Streptomyces himastatinicus ATCC 53653 TaxID=457427 RepID=D9WV28_9ACTN|nr:ribose operon repressor [Streptomyces himastatinicus ATCC 53653]
MPRREVATVGEVTPTPTIKTVAEAAGVSPASVSRALNGNPTIAPEIVERVMRAADAVGYRPNGIARSLRTRTTKVIALLIPDIGNPFFTAVARGVTDAAEAEGYTVLLCNTDEDPEKERRHLAVAEQARVAGVVLSPQGRDTDISRLRQSRIPVVVIDRPLREKTDAIVVPSFVGARDATRHLIEQGWSRPACITGPASADTARARLRGYRAAIREHDGMPEIVAHADFRQDGAMLAARELLARADPPDAFFVANAPMALGTLAALAERGLRVGSDVGFVSFDDAPWAPYMTPPISVVAQPAHPLGERSARLLLESLRAPVERRPRRITLSPTLIVRAISHRPRRG